VLKKKKVQLLREKLVFFLNGFPQSFYVPFTQNMRSGVQKSPIHSIYSFMKQYKFLNLTILCEKKNPSIAIFGNKQKSSPPFTKLRHF
jgi:hypothetical protein